MRNDPKNSAHVVQKNEKIEGRVEGWRLPVERRKAMAEMVVRSLSGVVDGVVDLRTVKGGAGVAETEVARGITASLKN